MEGEARTRSASAIPQGFGAAGRAAVGALGHVRAGVAASGYRRTRVARPSLALRWVGHTTALHDALGALAHRRFAEAEEMRHRTWERVVRITARIGAATGRRVRLAGADPASAVRGIRGRVRPRGALGRVGARGASRARGTAAHDGARAGGEGGERESRDPEPSHDPHGTRPRRAPSSPAAGSTWGGGESPGAEVRRGRAAVVVALGRACSGPGGSTRPRRMRVPEAVLLGARAGDGQHRKPRADQSERGSARHGVRVAPSVAEARQLRSHLARCLDDGG